MKSPSSIANLPEAQRSKLEIQILQELYAQHLELFAFLLESFHKLLLLSPSYSALINVRNKSTTSPLHHQLKSEEMCQLFYHATADFNQHMIDHLSQSSLETGRKVRAVTVEVDYKKLQKLKEESDAA